VDSNGKPVQTPCDILAVVIGIDHLSKFERVGGSYRIDNRNFKWIKMTQYGWAHVIIPGYGYGPPLAFDKPFRGVRFSDDKDDISVSIYSVPDAIRMLLADAARDGILFEKRVVERHKDKHVFSFLTEALGIYVDGFKCGRAADDKSVAMFMSATPLPINGELTKVYRLSEPSALLLVASAVDRRTSIKLIFPSAKDTDTLDYVHIFAPKLQIQAILNTIKKE
jgi:hypothetical protein